MFSVTLHPPCPSVNDKMEAPKELLAKLGLLPMPPDSLTLGPGGCVVGMLPPGGQVPIAPIGAPMGSAPAHLMGGPSTGVSLAVGRGIKYRVAQNTETQQAKYLSKPRKSIKTSICFVTKTTQPNEYKPLTFCLLCH